MPSAILRLINTAIKISFIAVCILSVNACISYHLPAAVESLSTAVATPENLNEITTDSYVVKPGDTLFAIAFYSGNDYRELAKLNGISAPFAIKIGQTIILKPKKSTIKSAPIEVAAKPKQEISVDPVSSQEYGDSSIKNHRKKPYEKQKPSNKVDNDLSWIWPATGSSTIAKVGSDGSKRGLDIKGKLGSTVKAAADGKVVYAGNALKGYGNLIIIKHNQEYLSAYAHNQSLLVKEQSFVKKGQQIASMGNSGAKEVMLHFEIRKKGKSIDPLNYLPAL